MAYFICEADDLSDSDYAQPLYRREISIFSKVEKETGIKPDEISNRCIDFERDKISPLLSPTLMELLMDALTDMDCVEIHDGSAYATGEETPSRPKSNSLSDMVR